MRLLSLSVLCIVGAFLLAGFGRPEAAAPLLVAGLGFALGVGVRWIFARLRSGRGAPPRTGFKTLI